MKTAALAVLLVAAVLVVSAWGAYAWWAIKAASA